MTDIKAWVQEERVSKTHTQFSLLPLKKGMGTSIGNAMRRVLLSSIEGIKITSVKIDGVLHEFSTLPHVREDVLDILCNLKAIVLRLNTYDTAPETVYTATLAFKGKGIVTAEQLVLPSTISVINQTQPLFEAVDETEVHMTCTIEQGVGFQAADLKATESATDPDIIYLDASFSPVDRVNHEVTTIRVGKDLGYEKLRLDVWTNGGISPKEAVESGAKILGDQIALFATVGTEGRIGVHAPPLVSEMETMIDQDVIKMAIDDLGLNARALNCLKRGGISSVSQLVELGYDGITKIKNLGQKSIDDITEKLQEFDIQLEDAS